MRSLASRHPRIWSAVLVACLGGATWAAKAREVVSEGAVPAEAAEPAPDKAPSAWVDLLVLSPVRSLEAFRADWHARVVDADRQVPGSVDLEIRAADQRRQAAVLRGAINLPADLADQERFPGGTRGGLELIPKQRRLIGKLPDGEYLVAITIDGRRASGVAPLKIDAKYDPGKEPVLRLAALPLGPGEALPMVGLVATGPKAVDEKLTNMAAAFPTLTVDGVVRQLDAMTWIGPVGPLQPGQRVQRLIDLARYRPALEPKPHWEVAALVAQHQSAVVVVPADGAAGRAWDKAAPWAAAPPAVLLRGTVWRRKGWPAKGFEVTLSADGGRVRFRETCDAEGRYAFAGLPPREYHLTTNPPAFGQPCLALKKIVLEAGRTAVQDFTFDPTFALKGRVTYSDGSPARDVAVSVSCVSDDGRVEYMNFTKTDWTGHYTLGVPFEKVSYIGIAGTGKQPRPKHNLKAGQGSVDFELLRPPPAKP